jgi:hypothetical protein
MHQPPLHLLPQLRIPESGSQQDHRAQVAYVGKDRFETGARQCYYLCSQIRSHYRQEIVAPCHAVFVFCIGLGDSHAVHVVLSFVYIVL